MKEMALYFIDLYWQHKYRRQERDWWQKSMGRG